MSKKPSFTPEQLHALFKNEACLSSPTATTFCAEEKAVFLDINQLHDLMRRALRYQKSAKLISNIVIAGCLIKDGMTAILFAKASSTDWSAGDVNELAIESKTLLAQWMNINSQAYNFLCVSPKNAGSNSASSEIKNEPASNECPSSHNETASDIEISSVQEFLKGATEEKIKISENGVRIISDSLQALASSNFDLPISIGHSETGSMRVETPYPCEISLPKRIQKDEYLLKGGLVTAISQDRFQIDDRYSIPNETLTDDQVKSISLGVDIAFKETFESTGRTVTYVRKVNKKEAPKE